MKVFVIHGTDDAVFVDRLANRLRRDGVQVWVGDGEAQVGDNVLDRVARGRDDIEYVIAVMSCGVSGSSWVSHELSTWMLREALAGTPVILPVLLQDCDIPSFLDDHQGFDFREGFERPAEALLARIRVAGDEGSTETARCNSFGRGIDRQIAQISGAFRRGKLTLFCGAGVSISAGIPGWKIFLRSLLSDLFEKHRTDRPSTSGPRVSLAAVYQEYFDLSPIIVAQYLKNALGRDFQRTVRDALYASNPTSGPLIDALCELCRPQRESRALQGVVNFNFDDLIEQNLDRNKIRHRAIWAEGQRSLTSELPIYHVHGYLPQEDDADLSSDIVFSEDAYHSKFIDPFSWSNLIQLNQLNQNTCLFVGLGMADPNLRRLLDVSMRKNPEKTLDHFIVCKRHDIDDLTRHVSALGGASAAEDQANKLARMAEILEERDCNNLGLNVLWVDEFEDIPPLFFKIAGA